MDFPFLHILLLADPVVLEMSVNIPKNIRDVLWRPLACPYG